MTSKRCVGHLCQETRTILPVPIGRQASIACSTAQFPNLRFVEMKTTRNGEEGNPCVEGSAGNAFPGSIAVVQTGP